MHFFLGTLRISALLFCWCKSLNWFSFYYLRSGLDVFLWLWGMSQFHSDCLNQSCKEEWAECISKFTSFFFLLTLFGSCLVFFLCFSPAHVGFPIFVFFRSSSTLYCCHYWDRFHLRGELCNTAPLICSHLTSLGSMWSGGGIVPTGAVLHFHLDCFSLSYLPCFFDRSKKQSRQSWHRTLSPKNVAARLNLRLCSHLS